MRGTVAKRLRQEVYEDKPSNVSGRAYFAREVRPSRWNLARIGRMLEAAKDKLGLSPADIKKEIREARARVIVSDPLRGAYQRAKRDHVGAGNARKVFKHVPEPIPAYLLKQLAGDYDEERAAYRRLVAEVAARDEELRRRYSRPRTATLGSEGETTPELEISPQASILARLWLFLVSLIKKIADMCRPGRGSTRGGIEPPLPWPDPPQQPRESHWAPQTVELEDGSSDVELEEKGTATP